MNPTSPLSFPRFGGGAGVIEPVTSAKISDSGTGGDVLVTPPRDTTGASLLIAVIGAINQRELTLTDSMGNVWTNAANIIAGNLRERLAYVINPITGPGHTVTATPIFGDGFAHLMIAAFKTVGSLDQIVSDGSIAPGTLTPTNPSSLLITNALAAGGAGAIDENFQIIEYVAGPLQGGLAYLIQTDPLSVTPTWNGMSAAAVSMVSSWNHD